MSEKPVIIITGCSSGIGAYCAGALHRDGWRVFATVRRIADMAALENQGIETLIMDYTKPETIAALVDTVAARTRARRCRAVRSPPRRPGSIFRQRYLLSRRLR